MSKRCGMRRYSFEKNRIFTVSIITLTLMFSGCSNENAGKANKSKETSGSTETQEQSEKDKKPIETKGPLNVQFGGSVTYSDHHLTVEGKTNLPAGASVFVNPMALTSVTLMGTSGPTEVRQDGSFVYETEIPEEYEYGLNVKIRFRPEDQTSESIKRKYGEFGKKLKGSFVRLYAINEKVSRQASTTLYMPLKENGSATTEIVKPDWEKPDDYGNTNIRMEADVRYNKKFVFIKGKSNLIEGSQLDISVLTPEGSLSGSGDKVRVNPDGSFRVQIENPSDIKKLSNYTVRLKFAPSPYSWDNIVDKYGESGQKMTGKLVEKNSVGEKKAFLKVKLN
ncbi:hypothetical protein GCM10009001_00580 [Virgibacillus siamensis]|uniref:Lipoprotein n=1 Tax=Virgibacillus siamensis TaxID=480071 RepID=A0ABP3QGW7_9BACI